VSSYKKLIIVFLLLTSSLFATNDGYKKLHENEDLYILFALEYEKNGQDNEARGLYLKLFDTTSKYEYLVRYLRTSLFLKEFKDVEKVASKNLKEDEKEYEVVLRLYCVALLNLKKYDEAFNMASILIKKYPNYMNYEVMANVYFVTEDFPNAKKYFESAYLLNKNSTTLFNLVNVLYAYLNEKDAAIAYLETHVRLYGCDFLICNKLLSIYQEQNNIDGAISVLKRSYFDFKEKNNYHSMTKIYKLLISYLEKKDLKLAIKFLEENELDEARLLSLYRRTNQLDKALVLVNRLYVETGNLDLLAQIAILEFEDAKDKQKVLKSVIEKFESALIVLDNHVYQNYLGYLLIDYELDVEKGIALVNQALAKAPNNVAYLDSLAWGQYKLKKCKDAFLNMKKVVDEVGLTDSEISHHWKKIKECKD